MVRKKGTGKRGPLYETKVAIILFLAGGKKKRQDVLEYLRAEYNIRDQRTIDTHLKKLIEMGILVKEEISIGLPIEYRLVDDYQGFQRIFDFIAKNHRELEIMRTEYVKSHLNETIFPSVAKEIMRVAIGIMTNLMVYALNPDTMVVDESIRTLHGRLNLPLQGIMKGLMLSTPKPEELDVSMLQQEIEKSFNKTPPIEFSIVSEAIFPTHEHEEILNILKSSPQALRYILSINQVESSKLVSLLKAYLDYYLPTVLEMVSENENAQVYLIGLMTRIIQDVNNAINKLEKKRDTGMDSFIREMFIPIFEGMKKEKWTLTDAEVIEILKRSSTAKPSPMLCQLKAILNLDMLSDNVIASDWLKEYRLDVLVDKDTLIKTMPTVAQHMKPVLEQIEKLKKNRKKKRGSTK